MKKLLPLFICTSLLFNFFACSTEPSKTDTQAKDTTGAKETLKETEKETVDPPTEDNKNNGTPSQDSDKTNKKDYYKNPIIEVGDLNTWQNYGVGDPFVMRHNGRYYLYCSTKDGMTGIQCWMSQNLVDWSYVGLCATEALTESAYAPEVVYYNGSFYMYTSPAGNGHYVLKSDSPTGPFVAVTRNFGLSIDGNVFIDDDGSWYFYSAANDGIMVYTMSAPDKVNSSSGVKIPCDMDGWTEGSMIVKHNGIYYMTYTGNHVWTAGYRINYAISEESPLKFEQVDNNPLLLSTNTDTVMGIGHSSTVLGPNLDEYYIVYHSHKSVPKRSMNIDRIVFNGTQTVVLGPTTDAQQLPSMPDLYSRFENKDDLSLWDVTNGVFENRSLVLSEGGAVLSKQKFEGDYTAEINVKSLSDSAGFVFDYLNEQNYAKAIYNGKTSTLTVSFVVNGEKTSNDIPISASFSDTLNTNALIAFTVRKSAEKYTIFVNNREVYTAESSLSGGAVGVICEKGTASVGFVGVTNGASQSTLSEVYKPVDCTIPAFTCTGTKNIKTYDKADYVAFSADKSFEYKVNVSKDGLYDIVVNYRSSDPCVLEIYQDGERIGEVTLSNSEGKLASVAGRGMTLASGKSTITLRVKEGSADILDLSFHKSEAVSQTTYDFESSVEPYYQDGSWSIKDGSLVLGGNFGKYMLGSENWSNYVVESDIKISSNNINAGLCVRVSNPSTYLEGNLSAGSDYLQGYYIGFSSGCIILGKHNYDWKELKKVSFDTKAGQSYHLSVEVIENEIRISVDGVELMTYTDTDSPFLHGMVGYRAHSSSMLADDLTISPIK